MSRIALIFITLMIFARFCMGAAYYPSGIADVDRCREEVKATPTLFLPGLFLPGVSIGTGSLTSELLNGCDEHGWRHLHRVVQDPCRRRY